MDVDAPPVASLSLRVLVVAEDPLARRALVGLLPPPAVAAQASGHGELAAEVRRAYADVVLWDLGADPTRAGDRLVDVEALDVPLVTLLPDATWCLAALQAGARAVLPRDVDAVTLQTTLDAALRGLVVIDPRFCASVVARVAETTSTVNAVARTTDAAAEALTAREREVLQLLAEGLPNKLIAHRLGVSDHTVKFHVNSVMAKLGVQSRTEAVVRALRQGLVML